MTRHVQQEVDEVEGAGWFRLSREHTNLRLQSTGCPGPQIPQLIGAGHEIALSIAPVVLDPPNRVGRVVDVIAHVSQAGVQFILDTGDVLVQGDAVEALSANTGDVDDGHKRAPMLESGTSNAPDGPHPIPHGGNIIAQSLRR